MKTISATVIELENELAQVVIRCDAAFVRGSFENSGLRPQSFAAVVSVEALWLASDQQRALDAVARLLRPDRRVVFTSWEQHLPRSFVKQPVTDYRPILESAGYEYPPHSEALRPTICERVRHAQATLIEALSDAVRSLIGEAHFVPGLIDVVNYIAPENGPHVLVCARRN